MFPGEAGSGIATPKGYMAGSKNTPGTSGSKKGGRPSAGTLDSFLRPRTSSTPSQSTSKTAQNKDKAPLSFAPASNSRKGKEVVVHVLEDESQVQFLGFTDLALSHDEQQQRHITNNDDATTSSDAEPDLRSEMEEDASAEAEEAPLSNDIQDKESTPYVLPPMPMPMPRFLRSMFGFGELPPPFKTEETVNTKKRKRAVVESSSPVKSTTLVGPSSPAPSTRSARSESVETVVLPPTILVAETEQQPSTVTVNFQATSKTSTENTAAGHGDRIAWSTQDNTEYRRLNRTESERLVDEELIVRRGPREALPATQERTDYMDRFRSESYSPVQYTATEGQMNEFRRRVGLSPIQRLPSQKHTLASVQPPAYKLPMMDLEDDEATEISEPPSQHPRMHGSFDESATQHSTCSQSSGGIEEVTMMNGKADDSGFVQSLPKSDKTRSNPTSDSRLEDALSKARIEVSDARSSSLSPVPPGYSQSIDSLIGHFGQSDSLKHLQKQEICLDNSSSAGESDFDESTILTKPRERRILALATQETQDFETQFIRIEETQLVPCSQEESSELDSEIDMHQGGITPVETETMKVANTANFRKRVPKVRSSVSEQIDAAWFPQILASATAASSAKSNEQEQSILTDFFGKKPGGPAEKASAEKKARDKAFANEIVKQRRESRKMKLDGSSLDPVIEGDDVDDDDDIEVVVDNGTSAGVKKVGTDDVGEIEDSDTEEMMKELDSQTTNEARLPCEGWVLGQKRHKTPTPVKQYRYRHIRPQ